MDIPSHRTGVSGREAVADVNERFLWRDLLDFVSYLERLALDTPRFNR
jgi:hypothetical protein